MKGRVEPRKASDHRFYYAVTPLAVFLFNFLAMPLARFKDRGGGLQHLCPVEQDKVGRSIKDNRILFTDKGRDFIIYKGAMVSDDDFSARLLGGRFLQGQSRRDLAARDETSRLGGPSDLYRLRAVCNQRR